MKIEFLLDNEEVSGVHVFEALKQVVPKRWFQATVQVGDSRFDLNDHANHGLEEMMYTVTRERGSKKRMMIEIPDDLVQDGISEVRRKLFHESFKLSLPEGNPLRETPLSDEFELCTDESSSFMDGEQDLAPTGSLG